MKKKIGELYNKPIIIGNKNEVTKNEVHIDELSGGNTGGEEMIYFNVEKLNSLQGSGIYSVLELLGTITTNTYTTTVPIGYTTFDSFVGTEKVIVGVQPYGFYYYVAFPNNVTVPKFLHLGSQPMPVEDIVGEKISFYELLEYINQTLKDFGEDMGGIPINEIKTCEVTKEEVMQWLQTPVEE
jgi:hypothetical protein